MLAQAGLRRKLNWAIGIFSLCCVAAALTFACNGQPSAPITPAPTPTSTLLATFVPTDTPTPTAEATPSPPTPTPTAVATPSPPTPTPDGYSHSSTHARTHPCAHPYANTGSSDYSYSYPYPFPDADSRTKPHAYINSDAYSGKIRDRWHSRRDRWLGRWSGSG